VSKQFQRLLYLVAREFVDYLTGQDGDTWILTNAPPVRMDRAPGKAAYAWSKMGMSFVTLSLAEELGGYDVGCNSFWPVIAIDTRATRYFRLAAEDDWRAASVVSDTVLEILKRDAAEFTGEAVYDEVILREAGVEDFEPYNLTPGDPDPTSARMFDPAFERPE
jgi:citronellol/citronellal dehydrogenase